MYESGNNCITNDEKNNNCFNGRACISTKKFWLCLFCFCFESAKVRHALFEYLTSSLSRFIMHLIHCPSNAFCSNFRNKSTGIFVLGVFFFIQTNFDFLTSPF